MKEMTLDFKTIPSVAVLLSSYNGSKFIERQVQSILNQKDVKVTLFIRDDGSKDEKTLEILEEYKKIENIVLVQEQNVGLAVSFMNLVYMAKDSFDYYCFADQDDIWLEEKLIEAIKKIKDYDTPVLYVSNQTLVDSNEKFLYFSISLMESYPLNFKITYCLKNFTPAIVMVNCSFSLSRTTSFNFLKRFTSSVVGNTFTSPRIPCVCVITPTCNLSIIIPLFPFVRRSAGRISVCNGFLCKIKQPHEFS